MSSCGRLRPPITGGCDTNFSWQRQGTRSVRGPEIGEKPENIANNARKYPLELSPGNTRSGVPGRSRRYRRNRSPNACTARRTRSSGCVFWLRTRAIVADRCSRLTVSAIGLIPAARKALPHILATLTLRSAGLPHRFRPLFKILRRIANPCTPVRFRYSPPPPDRACSTLAGHCARQAEPFAR